MIPFFSRRNQVYPVLWNGRRAVEKHFERLEDWRREHRLYQTMKMPHPALLEAKAGVLVTAFCPYPTLLEELERQEEMGFCPAPWEALAEWILGCARTLGQLPPEGNLRNFLWDTGKREVIGLDFECYQPGEPAPCGARLAAALLAYTPQNTKVKKEAAELLSKRLGVSETALRTARTELRRFRNGREKERFSGIVLAGGHSSRMGQDKAALLLRGKSLLELQIEKLREIGAGDIMLSGKGGQNIPGVRAIPDILPDRGPLGGIHACLKAAEHPRCLVVAVDIPLLPPSVLSKLCCAHRGGITVLRHGEAWEPLIAVYDRSVADDIGALILEGGAPVGALRKRVAWSEFPYRGPEEFLLNCNTVETFRQAEEFYTRTCFPLC